MAGGWNRYQEPTDLYGNNKTILCVMRESNGTYIFDYAIRNIKEWKEQYSNVMTRLSVTLFYSTNVAVLWFDNSKTIEYTGSYTVDVYYK